MRCQLLVYGRLQFKEQDAKEDKESMEEMTCTGILDQHTHNRATIDVQSIIGAGYYSDFSFCHTTRPDDTCSSLAYLVVDRGRLQ
jgi:hypothetical protein